MDAISAALVAHVFVAFAGTVTTPSKKQNRKAIMIQHRRHSRKVNGSTKSNKTFDKHNGIKRLKDEEIEQEKELHDWVGITGVDSWMDSLSDNDIDDISETTGVYI